MKKFKLTCQCGSEKVKIQVDIITEQTGETAVMLICEECGVSEEIE